jgi:hypothetical protein
MPPNAWSSSIDGARIVLAERVADDGERVIASRPQGS